jgi:ATP-dependent 26S proteasome regulatory subunit
MRDELIGDRGDRFCGDSGMIMLIVDAPNRLDVLDSMLLHLGCFDR